MIEPNSIEDIVQKIKDKLVIHAWSTKKHVLTLYAFNGTWKTRLSSEFTKMNIENEEGDFVQKTLCYNAFLEDLFTWENDIDNNNYTLRFNRYSWEANFINDEWLDLKISNNFQKILSTETQVVFNPDGNITFNIASKDGNGRTNIKISRGEESMFIWTVFYSIIERIINELNTDESSRSTHYFDNLEYIVIDDPVSSIDDTRIIMLAMELINLLNECKSNSLKFIITTHHALFYNILYNSFKSNGDYKDNWCILLKNDVWLDLKDQWDSPFWYHLLVIDEIYKAIVSDNIQRYHFNLFRGILEKTANFLWIKRLCDCVNWDEKFIKLINIYSHNRLEPMEYREVPDNDKNFFKETFHTFISEHKYLVDSNIK